MVDLIVFFVMDIDNLDYHVSAIMINDHDQFVFFFCLRLLFFFFSTIEHQTANAHNLQANHNTQIKHQEHQPKNTPTMIFSNFLRKN